MSDLSRLTEQARKVVSDIALREALSLGHNYVGPEHLLLASAREALSKSEAESVRTLVLERITRRCPTCGQLRETE